MFGTIIRVGGKFFELNLRIGLNTKYDNKKKRRNNIYRLHIRFINSIIHIV